MSDSKEFEIYDKLADALDNIPNAFPKTEDDTYIRLLKWIFSPEEALIGSQMKINPETIETLTSRIDIPKEQLIENLTVMAKKGLIASWETKAGRVYILLQFVVGSYEEQVDRMDEELARLFEEYYQKSQIKGLFDTEPAIYKIIPVKETINSELAIFPFEDAETMIKGAKSWGVRDCICRKQKTLIGEPCNYPRSVCLTFSNRENAYTEETISKKISMERSLELLKEAEEAGLIHSSMNIVTGISYICNCCTCCCGILRGLTELEQPNAFVNSNYVMTVDEDACIGCGSCIDRCQFSALELTDDIVEVDSRCVGCGICALSCPEDALKLELRDQKEIKQSPQNQMDWMQQKSKSRKLSSN